MMCIENLKKIELDLHVNDQKEGAGSCRLAFIYGLSTSGLCPFEAALHQKAVGASLQMVIHKNNLPEFFGHLYPAVCGKLKLPGDVADLVLHVSVKAIETPEDREIIQAMARSVGHGCGGSCDCGCS